MASEVGPIPVDGGDLLKLLIRVREVVEDDTPIELRRKLLRVRLNGLPWQDLIARLGGADAIVERLLAEQTGFQPSVDY